MKTLRFCLAVVLPALVACQKPAAPPPPPPVQEAPPPPLAKPLLEPAQLAIFGVLPTVVENPNNPLSPEKLALGKMLYFDPRLSKNHDLSCASCHDLTRHGADAEPTSPGHKGRRGTRNSQTTLNAAIQFSQFWDGRAADVEEQALGPIENPVEMASSGARVVATLKSIPAYVDAFKKAFPEDTEAVSFKNVGKALGAYERTLMTPSRWDKYLAGDKSALTDEEVKGAARFLETGCQTCHMGPGVGGTLFQKLGLVKPWPDQKDLGRYEVTKQEADKFMFKVPVLRNVEKTGPYFHDGSVASLEQAVTMMADHQLGKSLTPEQAGEIVTFLKTLTGELPAELAKKPELPPSTKKTPKPDPT